MNKKNVFALCPIAAAIAATLPAWGQTTAEPTPTLLDPVVVSAERSRQSTFDAPAAISAITRETIEGGGLQVNLSEVLNRVPGITVLNRQNYAQDLQLSIRGFGSRSTFGIRGVRLIVDGIPASMPDGQGQASSIALASAGRIEVLRGPLAQLYGNAAGGVVQVFTDMDEQGSSLTSTAGVGPYGQRKLGFKLAASGKGDAVVLDASTFRTDGYREHSNARRDQINGKWQHEISPDTRFSLVFNSLDQPLSLDPLGLTRAQFEADPRQAVALAKTQDARKSVLQQQIGGVLEHRLAPKTELTARVYFGNRNLDNALSIPPAAQTAATASGGIIRFDRDYAGVGLQLSHAIELEGGRALRLVGGVDFDESTEDRQGYINTGGVQGALKRDELNRARNRDVFAQASFDFLPQWTATAGLRASSVRFESADRYIATGNPDDSGGADYSATSPVLGITWRASPTLNLYANAGKGFETPTFTELSYRPVGTGLNTDLKASRSRHAELGAKWKLAEGHRIDAAVFDITTSDEIVVDTNSGGRSTFKNAGKTRRQGGELAYQGQLSPEWRTSFSATLLRARFVDAFVSGSGTAAAPVAAGNRLAGTPERSGFAEIAWAPRAAWAGFNTALEVVHNGALYVNDINEDAAAAVTLVNWRAGLAQRVGNWKFSQLLRVDNLGDKTYAGSVIVNDANKRFFEPALPRNWMLALSARYEWQ
jgi:iron complex outermembrane recepter protein